MKKIAEPERLLREGLSALQLDADLLDPLQRYMAELLRWNRAFNLTAVREPAQIVTRHLLDCLSLIPALELRSIAASPLLDVGSGAGLPGVLVAMARPQWQVDVLDSNGKKARFLRHVQRQLDLPNLRVIEARVETLEGAGPYAAITSRAYASTEKFFSSTRHLLAPDGRWLAMRGHVDDNDGHDSARGVLVEEVVPLHVPGLQEARHLLIASVST